jgi:hypothetical protein
MAVASDWVPLSGVWRRDNRDAIEAERTIVLQSRLAELMQARVDGAHAHLGAAQAGEAQHGRRGLASARTHGAAQIFPHHLALQPRLHPSTRPVLSAVAVRTLNGFAKN